MEEEKSKKQGYIQKWWFWVCMVLIALIIGFVIIMITGFNSATSGIAGVALEIQNINETAIFFGSAGENTLFLQIETNGEDIQDIKNIILDNYETELSSYTKLIILDYVGDNTIAISKCSLPNFVSTSYTSYIDFDVYSDLYNTYTDLYDTYDDLFDKYTELYSFLY